MSYWYPLDAKLVLASRSPRRADVLHLAGVPHMVFPSSVVETPMEGTPTDVVKHWAMAKAVDVASNFPDRPVLGADTVVFSGGVVMGKPEDADEAFDMLKSLSGSWHRVFSGIALVWQSRGVSFCFAEATRVKFRSLCDDEIRAYLASGEPFDKAGAYGIQGLGCVLIERIDGCYFNVMGLPVSKFLHRLRESIL